jgi:hypothetical protein
MTEAAATPSGVIVIASDWLCAGGIMTEKSSLPLTLAVGLAALVASASLGLARAETIVTDDQLMLVPSDIARPAPGMTMQGVEAKFGAPTERHAAVGTPAITRWDYQGFSVFFENDRVIHAVVTSAPAA